MIPIIALVGRPNVGKSTLFNYLTKSKQALVSDEPGVTRDRQYGKGIFEEFPFLVIDTGGLSNPGSELQQLMTSQAEKAIADADIVFFMVDAHAGLTPDDKSIAEKLRTANKKIYLLVNKTDGTNIDLSLADFYELGLGAPIPISAKQRQGIKPILAKVFSETAATPISEIPEIGIKIAFIGKPNVGKSTLVNRILGEERVIVSDLPGTTRDSIFIPFQRKEQDYVLIDTAGIRRRSRIDNTLEKFSIGKSLQAILAANVVLMIIDAHSGIAEQDLHLLGHCLNEGKALIILVNKWDNMTPYQRAEAQKELDRRLDFISFARIHFISALHGTGVGNIFSSINEAYQSAIKKIPTPKLNKILREAVLASQPPMVKGHRIKLRYTHQGGNCPPLFVIHGTQTEQLPEFYRKYLANTFRRRLNLPGTPIRISCKNSNNPFRPKNEQAKGAASTTK